MSGEPEPWRVFLAYRQRDGRDTAEWLYRHLHGLPVTESERAPGEDVPRLEVYYDQTAAAVADWKVVHGSALKKAKALILICSPGVAALRESAEDHVFTEISWWIEQRPTAPIMVDNTGDDDRWIPEIARSRWPDAQRIRIVPEELESLPEEERVREEARIAERIRAGIIASQSRVVDQELLLERRRSKRLRFLLSSVAVLLVATLVAGIFATSYWQRSERLLEESLAATSAAETELYYSSILLGQRYIENALYELAQETLRRGPEHLRNWEWGYLMSLTYLELPGRVPEPPASVPGAPVPPAASFDRVTWRWVGNDRELFPVRIPIRESVGDTAFSRDGRWQVQAEGAAALVLDARDSSVVAELVGHTESVRNACLSYDGSRVATSSDDRTARIWDAATGQELAVLRGHRHGVRGAAFSPDGSRLVTVSDDGSAAVWDASTGRRLVTLLTLADPGFRTGADPYGILVGGARARGRGESDGLSRYRNIARGYWRAPSFSPDGNSIAVEYRGESLVWRSYPFRAADLPEEAGASWTERFELWRAQWEQEVRARMTSELGVAGAWSEGLLVQRVSNVDELVDAIGPNRILELAGGTYDVSALQGRPGEFIRWDPNFDGATLTIHDVENLVIRGAPGERVEIVARPGYVFVLCFDGCSRVELRNLVLGHAPDPGGCEAGVIGAVGCSRLSLVDCDLFGSGTEGLTLLNVTDSLFERVTVRDCTYGGMTIDHCSGLRFRNLRMIDNEEYWGILVQRSRDVVFLEAEIEGNVIRDPLFEVSESHNIVMSRGRIRDNRFTQLERNPGSVLFEDVAIEDRGR